MEHPRTRQNSPTLDASLRGCNLNERRGGSQAMPAASQEMMPAPSLPDSELIEELNLRSIALKNEDLTRPTTQRVYDIHRSLLGYFQVDQSSGQLDEDPEEYRDALLLRSLYLSIKHFYALMGINFELADLTQPSSARLREILSGVINFDRYREYNRQTENEYLEIRAKYETSVERAKERLAVVQQTLSAVRGKQAEEQSQIKGLEGEKNSLKTQLNEFVQLDKRLRQERELVKERSDQVNKDHENSVFLLETTTQNRKELEAKLVNNPEQIKSVIKVLQNDLESARQAFKEHRDAAELAVKKNRMAANQCKFRREYAEALRDKDEAIKGAIARRDVQKKLEEKKGTMEKQVRKITLDKELAQQKAEGVHRLLENKKEQMEQNRVASHAKREALEAKRDELQKGAIKEMNSKIVYLESKVKDMNRERESKEREIFDAAKKYDDMSSRIVEEYIRWWESMDGAMGIGRQEEDEDDKPRQSRGRMEPEVVIEVPVRKEQDENALQ